MYDVEIACQRDVTSDLKSFCSSKGSTMIDPVLEPFQFPGQDSIADEEREVADGGGLCNLVKVLAWPCYTCSFRERGRHSRGAADDRVSELSD